RTFLAGARESEKSSCRPRWASNNEELVTQRPSGTRVSKPSCEVMYLAGRATPRWASL
ncbi:hypothetical protein A2U01_0074327, partial [Trifolium medium]|nr:hypothetical protein [Trifolium medium]